MSNYHSIIRNYGEPQSNFNAELAIKALSYKQEKYDANAAKIQETLSNYGNIDFARPEDRQNFYNKINNHIENIEGLKGADLSSAAITNSITGHISKALDQETLKQVGQTQQIRQFQQGLTELQKKTPNAITQTNYQHALVKAGYDKYMSGESDDLGKLNYTPYIEPVEDILDRVKKVKDVMGNQSVDLIGGDGQIYTTTTDNMTVMEWTQYLPQLVTQQNREQFRIDGSAAFGFDDEAAKQNLDTRKQALVQPLLGKVKHHEAILDDTISDEASKEAAKAALSSVKKEIEDIEHYFSRIPKTADGIGGYFTEKQTVQNIAQMIGSDPSLKISKDGAYFEQLKAAQDATNANPFAMGRAAVTELGSDTSSPIQIQREHQEGKIKADQDWKQTVNGLFGEIKDTGLRNRIKNSQDAIKKTNPGFSDSEALHEAILLNMSDNPEVRVQLNTLKDKRDGFIQAEARALRATAGDIVKTNYKEIYKALAVEKHRKTIGGVPVKEYLKSKGVNDAEGLLAFMNSEEGTELEVAIYADYFLSDVQTTDKITSLGAALTSDGHIGRFSSSDLFYFNRLKEALGEDGLKLTDIFDFEDATLEIMKSFATAFPNRRWSKSGLKLSEEDILESIGDIQENMFISLKPGAENTAVGKAILKTIENKEFTSPTLFNFQVGRDKTFYQDSKLREVFSFSNNQKRYQENLNAESIAIQGRNQVTINIPGTRKEADQDAIYQEAQRIASHQNTIGENFELQLNQPITISKNLKTGNVILSQFIGATRANYDGTPTISTASKHQTVEVSETDFVRLAPTLYNTVDLTQSENRLRFDANRTTESQPISFVDVKNETALKNAALFVGERGSGIQNMVTIEGTRNMIMHPQKGAYPKLSQPEFKPFKDVFEMALRNSNMFKAEMVAQGESSHVSVKVGNNEIYKIPLTQFTTAEEAERLVYGTPQVFLGTALMNIAIDLEAGESNRVVAQSFKNLKKVLEDNGAK